MGKLKKITNWAEYNMALYKRGSVAFGINDSATDAWQCKINNGLCGRGFQYSDTAIEIAMRIKGIFYFHYVPVQVFTDTIFKLLGVPLKSPD